MPDSESNILRRLDMTERNQTDLAKTVTELVGELNELRKPLDELRMDRAARLERDKHQAERFSRIEKAIDEGFRSVRSEIDTRWKTLQKPLWAAALAFISVLVASFWKFVVEGGLNVGP